MNFLKDQKKEIKVKKRKKYFPRLFMTFRAVFLFLIIICFLFFNYQPSQAIDPIQENISISVTVEETAPPTPPPPSGGGGGTTIPSKYATVIFKGKAYPGAFVTILKNGTVASTVTADPLANFSVVLSGVPAGIWTFGVWAEDKEGRKSLTLNFNASLTRGTTTTFSGIFLPPTIDLSANKIPRGEVLNIYGYTAPKSEVNVFINSSGEILKKTKADDDGGWLYAFDTSIIEKGRHTTRSKALSAKGEISIFSQSLAFDVLPEGTAVCCGADINCDGKVNLIDFSIMLYWWEAREIKHPCVDINFDGKVNLIDFSIMLYHWTE
ncbi:hypothetical protein KAW43_00555 [Candidatus Parcubacteria bacterium]|nr:hypothetical protein [Candidatus Parcubacteria bacterium]